MPLLRSQFFRTHIDKENEDVLFSREMYDNYRKYCKTFHVAPQNKLYTYTKYKDALHGLFQGIGELLVEKESGVLIKGLGYLFVFRSYNHIRKRTRNKDYKFFSLKYGGMRTRIIFLSDYSDFHLPYWTFESSISDGLFLRIKEEAQEGKKYKGLPFSLKRMIGRPAEESFKILPAKYDELI